jgi:hypothetical protein
MIVRFMLGGRACRISLHPRGRAAGGWSCSLNTTVAMETSVGDARDSASRLVDSAALMVIPMTSYTCRSNEFALSASHAGHSRQATLPLHRLRSGSEVRRTTRHGRSRCWLGDPSEPKRCCDYYLRPAAARSPVRRRSPHQKCSAVIRAAGPPMSTAHSRLRPTSVSPDHYHASLRRSAETSNRSSSLCR